VSEIIGVYACPLCGKINEVKKSAQGRLTSVCRWQDGGCGSQMQAQMPDAVHKMRQAMTIDPAKDEKPKKKKKEKHEPKVDLPPSASGIGDFLL